MTSKSDLAECRNCLCLASRSAARAITAIYDRHLRPHGIRGTQFSILTALMMMEETAMGPLANVLSMDRTTLTRNLALLEDKGWARTRTHPEDARSHLVSATAAGEKMVRAALPAWRKAQDSVARTIGPGGVAGLNKLAQTQLS